MSNPILQNPVSLIGSAKRIWPLGYGSHGWVAMIRWLGVTLLVLLAWVGVLAWYVFMTGFGILWIIWGVWTLRRRHFVYDARRYRKMIG